MQRNIFGENSDLFKLLWSLKTTPSAQLLGWRVLLDKTPTIVNLGLNLELTCVYCVMKYMTQQHDYVLVAKYLRGCGKFVIVEWESYQYIITNLKLTSNTYILMI